MCFNTEHYRLKNIIFHKNRVLFFSITINLKILKNVSKDNFVIYLNLFFYKKKFIERFKNGFCILTLWNNFEKKLCGYWIFKKKNSLKNTCNNNQSQVFSPSLHLDAHCFVFDLFILFRNNYTGQILISYSREDMIIRATLLKKIMSINVKYSFKNCLIFQKILKLYDLKFFEINRRK